MCKKNYIKMWVVKAVWIDDTLDVLPYSINEVLFAMSVYVVVLMFIFIYVPSRCNLS